VVFLGVFDAGGQTLRVDSPLDVVQLRVLSAATNEVADEGQQLGPRSVGLASGGFYYRKAGMAVFRPLATSGAAGRATDGAAQQRRCAPRRSKTLAATSTARVYSLPNNEIFACRYRNNRPVFLGTSDDCLDDHQARLFRLAGKYVAHVETECRVTAEEETVVVKDLTNGDRVHAAAAAQGVQTNPNRQPNVVVRDLVLNAKGEAAWIGLYDADGEQTVDSADDDVQVYRMNSFRFGGELVDDGQDIGLDSLALAGAGFYYRKGASVTFQLN
jgi:hypothetical protein